MSRVSALQRKMHPSDGVGMNPHQAHPATPVAMFMSLWRNRSLIWQMTRREILGRYRGSVMGLAWSFFNPVLMLFIYTFVFSVVFKARWGVGGEESKADFAIILFVGMIVHGLFAECINRAPGLILSNVNYVKKVVFPLEILPWVAMGSALFNSLVSTLVLLLAQLIINQFLPWTCLFFPLVLLPIVFAGMGFAWFLAALGVYLRDIGQITGIFTTVLMFLSPVFYPMSALPKAYQGWLQVNPLTLIIEESRKVLVFGSLPDWIPLSISLLASLAIAAAGFWWFQKTRKGFADVI
ncbi:ABC-2 type transporter [Desulfotomaculum nigrificans CO-1-SRB]|uniref:Transport permease protein n=1 Tax=Desulfotomaculum nigrificans (strain DSM 14880 / VKM B-2319 / CO-1-SRB) TaxID=868595 RepID=F6B5J8_DESCC|nr:ABC transporter permease [Desulfotomaculum nigrificans]AEF95430.1 ABC-2 type transporter [Desulfotomaculum nigrificans CO-1-SRB]